MGPLAPNGLAPAGMERDEGPIRQPKTRSVFMGMQRDNVGRAKRISRNHKPRPLRFAEDGVALETLIAELAKQDVLITQKAKHARFAAGSRMSAAHGLWHEIQLGGVKNCH
jgi:hypothetical protein